MSKTFREWLETDYDDTEFDRRRSMDEAPRWVFLTFLCIVILIICGVIKLASWFFSLFA